MPSTQIALLLVAVAVVVVLVGGGVLLALRRRPRNDVESAFAAEYERAVEAAEQEAPRSEPEPAPRERERPAVRSRRAKLEIRPLSPDARERYLQAWEGVQTRFVDSPVLALSEAHVLLTRVLRERGFPADDARGSAALLSPENARVLEEFRAGHRIEQQNTTGRANTEQVRQGMLHFRRVFDELVRGGTEEPYPPTERPARQDREAPH